MGKIQVKQEKMMENIIVSRLNHGKRLKRGNSL